MLTSAPAQPGLIDRFGLFIERLKRAMADGIGRRHDTLGPLAVLLWKYLARTLHRLAALHAKFAAGKLPSAPRAPRPATARERPAPRIPPGPVLVPFHVGHLYAALSALIEDPEMVALLKAAPQAGRLLRPLWRRVTPIRCPQCCDCRSARARRASRPRRRWRMRSPRRIPPRFLDRSRRRIGRCDPGARRWTCRRSALPNFRPPEPRGFGAP